MRWVLLALVFITMTAPVYAERNCTDHFAEDAYSTWTNCTGTRTWPSGDVYEGDWKEGNFHGKGKYSGASGRVYEGDFKDDLQHGKGKYSYASGNFYEGDFKDDLQHGKGKYSWASGTTIREGIWVDGEYSKSLTTE